VRTDQTGKDSIAYTLYQHGRRVATGETIDPSFFMAWWEPAGAAAPVMDRKVWVQANPGLADILSEADLAAAAASVPSRTPEAEFRIKRLNQWVNSATAWLPSGVFETRRIERRLLPNIGRNAGEPIVLFFDGSFNHDCTILVACSLDDFIEPLAIWERPADGGEWEVPVEEVDAKVRDLCRDYNVMEIDADPFRWTREIQGWAAAGLPAMEYPTTSPSRMVPACAKFYDAVTNGRLTYGGDPRLVAALERHVSNAVVKIDRLGPRIVKEHRGSPRSIDFAVGAVGAYDRATFLASQPQSPKRLGAFLV
jgi:phage terminase large subunit-like protein